MEGDVSQPSMDADRSNTARLIEQEKERLRQEAARVKAVHELIETGLEEAAAALDKQAKEEIMEVSQEVDTSSPPPPPEAKRFEWSELKERADESYLIKLAIEDPTFREAVCIILKAIPEEKWDSDQAWALVRNWVKTHN